MAHQMQSSHQAEHRVLAHLLKVGTQSWLIRCNQVIKPSIASSRTFSPGMYADTLMVPIARASMHPSTALHTPAWTIVLVGLSSPARRRVRLAARKSHRAKSTHGQQMSDAASATDEIDKIRLSRLAPSSVEALAPPIQP